ncbi:MAG TPA: response regulator transcription factor [Actinomycetes bacterium]|nr:response regulator transcription factor [Actinomycetes bacterium]
MSEIEPGPTHVRVLIVDDDPLVRSALRMVLGGADGILLVGEVADGSAVTAAVDETKPDVVLMDIRMPRVDGLTATEQVRRSAPAPEVVILTTFDADEHVLRALRAGASGFLLKDTPPADIVEAVRRVAEGDPILAPAVTRRLMGRIAELESSDGDDRRTKARSRLGELTDREREVAMAVGRGLSNAEIAAALYMSVATVKAYVSRLLTKLDAGNRVQVALLVHDAEVS